MFNGERYTRFTKLIINVLNTFQFPTVENICMYRIILQLNSVTYRLFNKDPSATRWEISKKIQLKSTKLVNSPLGDDSGLK